MAKIYVAIDADLDVLRLYANIGSYTKVTITKAEDLNKLRGELFGASLFELPDSSKTLVVELANDDLAPNLAVDLAKDFGQTVYLLASKKAQKYLAKFERLVIDLPETLGEARDFASKVVSQAGGTIDKEALDLLVGDIDFKAKVTWGVFHLLRQDLLKMLAYDENKHITKATASLLMSVSFDENIFTILRKIAARDTQGTLSSFKKLMAQGMDPEDLVPILSSQIVNLLWAKSLQGKSPEQVAKLTGWEKGKIWAITKEAKNFSQEELERAVKELLSLDIARKTSMSESEAMLASVLSTISSK
jgi:DNA polymerase III delta subunit